MRVIITILLFVLHLCVYTFSSEILEKVFSPPTSYEIEEAQKLFPAKYSCEEFKVGDIMYDDEEIIVYKIKYLSDGLWVTGILAQPQMEGKYPLLILNHGGTAGLTKFDKNEIFNFAQKGYVVLASTYRGEEGLAGKSEGKIGLMKEEVNDVLNILECGKKLDKVDKNKIGMLGGSHGGGVTLLAIQRTKEVSVAVARTGPADMFNETTKNMVEQWMKNPREVKIYFSFFLSEAINELEEFFLKLTSEKNDLSEARQELLLRSPLYFTDRINCPLLLIYGEKDYLVSIEDAKNLIKKLKENNKIFDYRIYPQGHAILGKDREDAEILQDEFLKKYLRER